MAWRGIFRECYFFFVGSPFISFLYSSRKMTGRTLSSSASLRRRFIFHGFAELSCCVPQSGCRTFFFIKKTHITIAILCNAPAAAIDRRMSDPSSRNRKPPDSIFFFWLSPAARPRFSKRKKMEANEKCWRQSKWIRQFPTGQVPDWVTKRSQFFFLRRQTSGIFTRK